MGRQGNVARLNGHNLYAFIGICSKAKERSTVVSWPTPHFSVTADASSTQRIYARHARAIYPLPCSASRYRAENRKCFPVCVSTCPSLTVLGYIATGNRLPIIHPIATLTDPSRGPWYTLLQQTLWRSTSMCCAFPVVIAVSNRIGQKWRRTTTLARSGQKGGVVKEKERQDSSTLCAARAFAHTGLCAARILCTLQRCLDLHSFRATAVCPQVRARPLHPFRRTIGRPTTRALRVGLTFLLHSSKEDSTIQKETIGIGTCRTHVLSLPYRFIRSTAQCQNASLCCRA